MKVGLIAQPQAYKKQENILRKCGIDILKINNVKQLEEIDGLVLCGDDIYELGTIINKLNIYEKVLEMIKNDLPIMGISSAIEILTKNNKTKINFPGIIDMEIKKEDGYLEVPLEIPALGPEPFIGIFEKKIFISKIAPNIGILSQIDVERIVFVRQGNFLAVTFQPELANDVRVYKYFKEIIISNCQKDYLLL